MIPRRIRSVRFKLLLVVVVTTLSALLVTGAAMVFHDVRTYQQSWVDDLFTQADILGRSSAPALAFDDPKAASETLSLLQARPQITAAGVYTARGALFASYPPGRTDAALPALPEGEGFRIEGKELVVFKRIVERNEILGTVYLRARYELVERVQRYVAILGAVMIGSLLFAVMVSSWLQSVVTKPILAISDVARKVSESRDFSLRATKTTDDEIGHLVDGFNAMLVEIARRADVLEQANRTLEHEVEERRAVEEALRISEQRNSTLVAASTAVVWDADSKGEFTGLQSSWSTYTGQRQDEYAGVGWRKAFHADDQPTLEFSWAKANNHPEPFDVELRLWHAESAAYRYVSVRAVPVMKAEGEVREWIGTISDIEDQRRAEHELQQLNVELEQRVAKRTAELQAANKEMETFSYSVSHDLRAPLRGIVGFSQFLREDHGAQLDEEGRRKLGIIQSEAKRMGTLIDDLLAFSRLGRKAIEPIEIDMTAMARGMFERLNAQQDGARAELRLHPLPNVFGDRTLLEQVWANLVSNALKYSSKRERPLVEIGAIADENDYIYYVRDNGAGFDPRYKSKLFGVFQRLHDASEFPGTGVGLALVQRIVLRHHGRVWADSKPDHGASFYFALPRESQNAGN